MAARRPSRLHGKRGRLDVTIRSAGRDAPRLACLDSRVPGALSRFKALVPTDSGFRPVRACCPFAPGGNHPATLALQHQPRAGLPRISCLSKPGDRFRLGRKRRSKGSVQDRTGSRSIYAPRAKGPCDKIPGRCNALHEAFYRIGNSAFR